MSKKPPSGNGNPGSVASGARLDGVTDRVRTKPKKAVAKGHGTRELDNRLSSLRFEPTPEAPAIPPPTERRERRRRSPLLATAVIFVAVAALAIVLLRTFVIQSFIVPGDAMTPSLQARDRMLVLKSGFLYRSIERGDIIVFHPPKSLACGVVEGSGGDLVLRVVALPGDTIGSVDNTIRVNGQPLREPGWYDSRFGQLGSTPIRSTTLSADSYFVLADNRAAACDSRAFGPIPKASVVGHGIAIVGRDGHVFFGTP